MITRSRLAPVLMLVLMLVDPAGTSGTMAAPSNRAADAARGATTGETVPGRLVVRLRSDIPGAGGAGWIRRRWGAAVEAARAVAPATYVINTATQHGLAALRARIAADSAVMYVEPDFIYRATVAPNDQLLGRQYALPRIAAPQAWDVTTGSPDVLIAVVDTGVYAGHPDLGQNVVAGTDFVQDDADASDDDGHGTHTAGIIAAVTNNGRGVAGVCWQCRILPVKALNDAGAGSGVDVAAGIRYAVDRGAKVINLSLGSPSNARVLHDAVIYATNRGALVVVAAGNSGMDANQAQYPAAYPEALAVAATDGADAHAPFSNRGSYIDIAAPGVDVASTFWYPGRSEPYASASGTSEAAPFVAGVAGLIWSVNPSLTVNQVRQALLTHADDLGTPGRDDYFGAGRLNASRAVLAADAGNAGVLFPETGKRLRGTFRRFWEANGGLPVFGFPITDEQIEETAEGPFLVQYFERNRFELHPEKAAPYNVLLGRLGDTLLQRASVDWRAAARGQPQPGCQFFAETGRSLCEPFLSYWRTHGLADARLPAPGRSLALFGLPLTEPRLETNSSGDTVLTQWFERARFEHHTAGAARVLLGLLGNELRQPAVAEPPPATPAPTPAPVVPTPGIPAPVVPTPVPVSRCPEIPPAQDGVVRPDACLPLGAEMQADVFGFRPGEQVAAWLTGPEGQIRPSDEPRTADPDGRLAGQRMSTADLSPGRWVWVFQGIDSGHQSLVYFHLYSP